MKLTGNVDEHPDYGIDAPYVIVGLILAILATPGRTNGMVLAPDQETLYVANDYLSRVHVITLSTGAVGTIALNGGPFALGLGPDGARLYASLTFDGKVQVVDRANRRVIQTIVTGGAPRLMIADATQGLVVVANEAGWVDLLR